MKLLSRIFMLLLLLTAPTFGDFGRPYPLTNYGDGVFGKVSVTNFGTFGSAVMSNDLVLSASVAGNYRSIIWSNASGYMKMRPYRADSRWILVERLYAGERVVSFLIPATNYPTLVGMVPQLVGAGTVAWVSPTSLLAAVTNEVDPHFFSWWNGGTITNGAITDADGFVGPGSSLTDVDAELFDGIDSPAFLLKGEATTNYDALFASKLDSNTWADADSTTNSVKRTGDSMTGVLSNSADIIAANYSHNMPLLTNDEDVTIGMSANTSSGGTAVGREANGSNGGTAVGVGANGHEGGAAIGLRANGSESSAAVGTDSYGYWYGAALGVRANGSEYGSAIGIDANGRCYGAAFGPYANGSQTNTAIGAFANSLGGSERISIGHSVTNSIDNSAALRGTLYLDGGTGAVYRSTFGTGAWLPLVSRNAKDHTNLPITATGASVSQSPTGTHITVTESDPYWVADKAGIEAQIAAIAAPTQLLWGSVTVALLSNVSTNMCDLTNTYISPLGGVIVFTGSCEVVDGRTYLAGFSTAGNGASVLSVGGFVLSNATAGSSCSNYFTANSNISNLYMTLSGATLSGVAASNIYVYAVTGGTLSVAGDLNIGGTIHGPILGIENYLRIEDFTNYMATSTVADVETDPIWTNAQRVGFEISGDITKTGSGSNYYDSVTNGAPDSDGGWTEYFPAGSDQDWWEWTNSINGSGQKAFYFNGGLAVQDYLLWSTTIPSGHIYTLSFTATNVFAGSQGCVVSVFYGLSTSAIASVTEEGPYSVTLTNHQASPITSIGFSADGGGGGTPPWYIGFYDVSLLVQESLTNKAIFTSTGAEKDSVWEATSKYYRVYGPNVVQTPTGAVVSGTTTETDPLWTNALRAGFQVNGPVVVSNSVRVSEDIIAANYSHSMPLMTNYSDVALGLRANAYDFGTAIGHEATGSFYSVTVGSYASGRGEGAAFGFQADGSSTGAAFGYRTIGYDHGVSVGHTSSGATYGVSVGYSSVGSDTNVAVGAFANAAGGPNRTAIGPFVTNAVDNSAALRGTLYLDGGTGIYYRSTFGSGAWTLYSSGTSPDLTYLSNGVNSWIASSNELAVVTNDYPAGTLGILASSDGGTTLYIKAEAAATVYAVLTVAVQNAASTWDADTKTLGLNTNDSGAAETDPIWAAASNAYMTGASAAGLSNLVGVAQAWASTGVTAAATAQATGVAAFVWAEAARTNAEGRIPKVASPISGTMLYWNGTAWANCTNIVFLGTNFLFYWTSTNSPARFPCDGE